MLNIKKHFNDENQSFVSEYRIPSDDGKWLWFLQRGRGIRNESGRVTKMYRLIQNFHEEKKGYFPITEKEMTRFWYSMEDAVNFVDKSFKEMKGGEIFVLNMGQPVKIDSIAKKLVTLFYGCLLYTSDAADE